MRVAPENLLERNLIAYKGVIEATRTIGKRHRAAALQPSGDGGDLRRIADPAGGGQRQILKYVITLESGQRPWPAGDTGLLGSLLRYSDRRLFGYMNSIHRAARPVPLKPIIQKSHPISRDCSYPIHKDPL